MKIIQYVLKSTLIDPIKHTQTKSRIFLVIKYSKIKVDDIMGQNIINSYMFELLSLTATVFFYYRNPLNFGYNSPVELGP